MDEMSATRSIATADQEIFEMGLDASPLVSTEWLAAHLTDPRVRIVDVRWRTRYENGRGISFDDLDGYLTGHIPGAVFAKMSESLSDHSHPVPDMLAQPRQFSEAMGSLGIENDTLVVAYDNMGAPLGAARLWWALSHYGHDRVRVLDGGLREWQAEQRPLSTEIPEPKVSRFTACSRAGWLATKSDVLAAFDNPNAVVVDCLLAELYRGRGERHHWGERQGHIPGAVNIPYLANIDPSLADATPAEREHLLASGRSFRLGAAKALHSMYCSAGVYPDRQVITYCGRGYAGACGMLALKMLGYENVRLYDGSWSEWSADPDLAVEIGTPLGQ